MKILFLIFFLTLPTFSQNLPVDIGGSLFRYDEKNNLFEFYYSFNEKSLNYKYENGRQKGEIYFDLEIFYRDSLYDKKQWIVEHYKQNDTTDPNKDLIGQKNLLLPIGEILFKLTVKDLNDTSKISNVDFTINSRKFNNLELDLSDILIASKIEEFKPESANVNKLFIKEPFVIIPNPASQITDTNPKLYIYFEIYNALKIGNDSIRLSYEITDPMNKYVFSHRKTRKIKNDEFAEVMDINLNSIPSGVYYLNIIAKGFNQQKNKTSDFIAKSRRKFFLINPKMQPEKYNLFAENKDFASSEFATMGEEAANEEFEKISYIALPYELDLYRSCTTLEAKQRFLFGFWQRRDPDSTTAFNEGRMEYVNKIETANKNYSYGKSNNGWRTDRGKIFIKYGTPTQIDRKTQDGDNRPHEIWYYDRVLGGVSFVFVDIYGFGNYILVHSTAPGEIRNENWFQEYVIPNNLDATPKIIDRR
ncbi:MAG: GWxTD domain-containing protein [Candidatus Kapabacteria bacterium]|nr:GWxTD domain-containing protein [Candidatus Kapabacteria bacterium]